MLIANYLVIVATDRCTLQPRPGPCKANIPNYFYSTVSGSCEQFTYGGCGGNENRFETSAECALYCSSNCKSRKS